MCTAIFLFDEWGKRMIIAFFFIILALLVICFVVMAFYIIIDCISEHKARHDKAETVFVITCKDTGEDFNCEKICEVPYSALGLD